MTMPECVDHLHLAQWIAQELPTALMEQIGILDKAVAPTGYLAGDRFGFADINLMVILYYVKMFPEGAEALAGAKSLAAYYERNAQRPSFKNTIPPPPPARQAKG